MQSRRLSDDLAEVARANQNTRDAALLRATTELFVQDLSHEGDEIRRYEELALHFLPKVSTDDRAFVAERLAICPDAPSVVIRMLARDAIEVAAPVIRRSTVLDSHDMLSVIAATEVEHHRLLARRSDLSDDVKRALRLTGDAETTGYLDRGPAMRAAPAEAPAQAEAPEPAIRRQIVRPARTDHHFDVGRFLSLDRPTRLRVIADIAANPPLRDTAPDGGDSRQAFQSILSAAQVAGFARSGETGALIGAISDGLEINAADVAAALHDPGGEALAVMLKALRLDSTQAQQVFLLASPVGRNVQTFFPLTDLFAGMDRSTAWTLCDAWRLVKEDRKAGYEPFLAENGERRRGAAASQQQPARDSETGRPDVARRA